MEQTQKIFLYDVLNALPQKEKGIIELYLAGFTEEEIAESYNLSQPRIHQIKERALEKCKSQLRQKELECASIV